MLAPATRVDSSVTLHKTSMRSSRKQATSLEPACNECVRENGTEVPGSGPKTQHRDVRGNLPQQFTAAIGQVQVRLEAVSIQKAKVVQDLSLRATARHRTDCEQDSSFSAA